MEDVATFITLVLSVCAFGMSVFAVVTVRERPRRRDRPNNPPVAASPFVPTMSDTQRLAQSMAVPRHQGEAFQYAGLAEPPAGDMPARASQPAPSPRPEPRGFEDAAIATALQCDFNAEAAVAAVSVDFLAKWRPEQARLDGEIVTLDLMGDLWIVREQGFDFLLPGRRHIEDWERVFRTASAYQAREQLGPAFDLTDGATLQILDLPRMQPAGTGWRVVSRGVLAGT